MTRIRVTLDVQNESLK